MAKTKALTPVQQYQARVAAAGGRPIRVLLNPEYAKKFEQAKLATRTKTDAETVRLLLDRHADFG